MTTALNRSYDKSRAMTRRHARSFYSASHLLSARRRQAAFAIYAFCRSADDALDECSPGGTAERRQRLSALHERLDRIFADEVAGEGPDLALADVVKQFNVPRSAFTSLLQGMEVDLEPVAFQTTAELLRYAHLVAGVVGELLLPVLGASGEEAKTRANELGTAMQLTNILRDVGEDLERGRLYLPAEELAWFGLTHADVRARVTDRRWAAFVRWQIARARVYYGRGMRGVPLIGTWAGRVTALSMGLVYSGILAAIERNRYDVFRKRAATTRSEKLLGILRAVTVATRGRYEALRLRADLPALPAVMQGAP